MRSLFKGVIGFGLVSIPIQVYKAMESERVTTHWIHQACKSRIQYQKYCPVCEVRVSSEDIVVGAPLGDGRYVVLHQEERPKTGDHTITILNFPALKDIDPVFWETSYWLKPGPGGQKAYALLNQTMRATERVALAEMVLRTRRSLAVVRSYNPDTLMLHRMYYPESLRQEGVSMGKGSLKPKDRELEMAKSLVEQMAESFDPSEYPNLARQARLEEIDALTPTAEMPKVPANREVLDLMEKLKESVTAQRQHGTRAGS